MSNIKNFLFLLIVLVIVLACNFAAPTEVTLPTLPPATVPVTVIVESPVVPQDNLPRDDASVHRVTIDQAKAAFDSGDAIIVDVRGANAYALSHVAGSLEVSLSIIQSDPGNLPLDKNKWIITYCT